MTITTTAIGNGLRRALAYRDLIEVDSAIHRSLVCVANFEAQQKSGIVPEYSHRQSRLIGVLPGDGEGVTGEPRPSPRTARQRLWVGLVEDPLRPVRYGGVVV